MRTGIQAAVVIAALVLLHVPLGDYMARVLGRSAAEGAPHWRVERMTYRICGIDPEAERNWRQYVRSVFALSVAGILTLYLVLRLQAHRQTEDLGNFWVDFTRSITRVLLPLAVVSGVLLAGLGVIQNWAEPHTVTTLAGGAQAIPGGPVAAWESMMAAGAGLAEQHLGDAAPAAAHAAMEGKEVRFGPDGSSLFGISATSCADGAANSSYDSFTAFGGGVLMSAMMLGEISPGGVGSGLYGLLMIAVIAAFLGGLMAGRTPEFLRKRIGSREMTQVALYCLAPPFVLLAGAALAVALPGERASMGNSGPHGLSEVLYAFTSSADSNGSAFAGFNGNTTWYNVALGLVMLFGRYLPMVFVLALAGSLARQKPGAVTAGTLSTTGPLFVALTSASGLVLVGLTFVT